MIWISSGGVWCGIHIIFFFFLLRTGMVFLAHNFFFAFTLLYLNPLILYEKLITANCINTLWGFNIIYWVVRHSSVWADFVGCYFCIAVVIPVYQNLFGHFPVIPNCGNWITYCFLNDNMLLNFEFDRRIC